MKPNRVLTALMLGLLAAASPALAHAEAPKSVAKKSPKQVRHPIFSGYLVPEAKLRNQPLKRPSGRIVMYSVNDPKLSVAVNLYNANGTFNDEALDELNHMWRCRRTETEKQIDPHLFEILSHVYDHFQKPLQLISGFRNQKRTSSFHYVASASDISIAGVPDRKLKEFVESLDTGGMGIGIYPHAGFIHVDVRPEPSYRWVDYSPPGSSDMGQPKTTRKRAPNS